MLLFLFYGCCCCCCCATAFGQKLNRIKKKILIHNFIKCFFFFRGFVQKSFPGTNFQRKNRSSREEDDEDDNNNSDNSDINNDSSNDNNNNNSDNIYNNSNNVGRILSLFFRSKFDSPAFFLVVWFFKQHLLPKQSEDFYQLWPDTNDAQTC